MAIEIKKTAPKGKKGYTINFRHPVVKDRDGKYGLKIHRGLGTDDPKEADKLVAQLQELVDDETWWDYSKRQEAYNHYADVVVDAFFDAMESAQSTEEKYLDEILLPQKHEGAKNVTLLGPSGAGKTSLERVILGTSKERFPSTASGRTTTCQTEIITAPEGEYEAVVTFMSRHVVEMFVQENIEECINYCIEQGKDGIDVEKAEEKLLVHKDLILRLPYILGNSSLATDSNNMEEDDEEDAEETEEACYEYEQKAEALTNCIEEFVQRAIEIAHSYLNEGTNPFDENFNFEDEDVVLELRRDIVDEIATRFKLITKGRRLNQQGSWVNAWYYKAENKVEFLKTVKMFTSNSKAYWGGLLTPIVKAIRIKGHFGSEEFPLEDNLVIYDGEGLGHKTTLTSMPTDMIDRLANSDIVVCVDNALQPVMDNSKMALRTLVEMGLAQKTVIAFTHVDLMSGDNLMSIKDKKNHVKIALDAFLSEMKHDNPDKISAMEKESMLNNCFFFSDLHDVKGKFSKLTLNNLKSMFERIEDIYKAGISVNDVELHYDEITLYNHLKAAINRYRKEWEEKIGLPNKTSNTEFWSRIKALTRRLGFFNIDHYNYELMPLADLNDAIRGELNTYLNRPINVEPEETPDEVKEELVSQIKLKINTRLATFIRDEMWLNEEQLKRWQEAYNFRGRYSSYSRSVKIKEIFDFSAPMIGDFTYDMNDFQKQYIKSVMDIVRTSISENGSKLESFKEW